MYSLTFRVRVMLS